MKPRKHAELIKAWADGAEIQAKAVDGRWMDVTGNPCFYPDEVYRIKPEKKAIQYRRYLYENVSYHIGIHYFHDDDHTPWQYNFIRWIDAEWQEVQP